jgi:gamma-glutamyltranspeptidase/glutathione hydrolase
MGMLELGGNAFDAAVAAGFTLQVVDPNQCSLGGEVVILGATRSTTPFVLCGQGTTPNAATIENYRAEGMLSIPSFGLPSAVVPGAFQAWMILLRDYGTLSIETVLSPAVQYARHGHILSAKASKVLAQVAALFRTEWPTSAALYLSSDRVPGPGSLFTNKTLADTYERLIRASQLPNATRERKIDAAIDAFYHGFVAEKIEQFAQGNTLIDASGARHKGFLAADDLGTWRATYERPLSCNFAGYSVYKPGPWSQGPVLLQMLSLLKHMGIEDESPGDIELAHLSLEVMKLGYADREAWYGDPDFIDVPIEWLLSTDYNKSRAKLIGPTASLDVRPGNAPDRKATLPAYPGPDEQRRLQAIARRTLEAAQSADTCHIDVVDQWGNVVSATPSGGWFQSSPAIPDLGFQLSNRAQMLWLDENTPSALGPKRRPRTTLSPTLAISNDGDTQLAFGCRGGDVQDQWALQFFIAYALLGQGLQEAVDAPFLMSDHCTRSEFPRVAHPGRVTTSREMPQSIVDGLGSRGHAVRVVGDEILLGYGQGCAATSGTAGLRGAATRRLEDCSAVGR